MRLVDREACRSATMILPHVCPECLLFRLDMTDIPCQCHVVFRYKLKHTTMADKKRTMQYKQQKRRRDEPNVSDSA
jgi:hypothetical protein